MDSKKFSFVGPSCGHHASYTFYKAIKFQKNGKTKILSLGEFFFVKIWSDSDLVSIGELQLFWEDKNTNQVLSSLRLYFLPEYTPEGRMGWHGEDELVAVSEKAVLRVTDLLDWIADPAEINWDRGILGVCGEDCKDPPPDEPLANALFDRGLNSKFGPGHSDFLADVNLEKISCGDVPGSDEVGVVILSNSQYSRYRSIMKRIAGKERMWMHNSLVVALGGFTVRTRKTYVLFCRENFDYAELEEHPYLCNHLAPKLKGRPRKRKKIKRAGSPESESASSESSVSTASATANLQQQQQQAVAAKASSMGGVGVRNGVKKDFLSILSQKNTKDEFDFLQKLINFMEKRNTPIERPPMLGFKQIDLHLFYQKVAKLGGYDGCVVKKAWKAIYDELGGNPQNTSAATCTRRHYEKFLLPFEKHLSGQQQQQQQDGSKKGPRKTATSPDSNSATDSEKDTKSPVMPSSTKSEKEPSEGSPKGDEGEEESGSPKAKLEETEELVAAAAAAAAAEDKRSPAAAKVATDVEMVDGLKADNTSAAAKMDDDDIAEEEDEEAKEQGDVTSNPLFSQQSLQSLMAVGKAAATAAAGDMKIDSDRKRLQIDDLIIIPNHLNSPPEGGSALQNLAKIASRYQNPPSSSGGGEHHRAASPSSKKARVDQPSAATDKGQPVPASKKSSSSASVPPNNIFSLLPPGLLPAWPVTSSTSPAKSISPALSSGKTSSGNGNSSSNALAAAAAAALQLPDPSKLGPEGFNLLQYYEKQLKAMAQQQQQQFPSSSSPSPFKNGAAAVAAATGRDSANSNASGSSANNHSGSSGSHNKKDRSSDRSKVSKPPPETKRPPSLMQTPCAFVQTTSIYTNPLAELTKLREANADSPSFSAITGADALDLSSRSERKRPKHDPDMMHHHHHSSALNLKRESGGLPHPTLDLSLKKESSLLAHPPPMKYESNKASPFSAESLLSSHKPSSAAKHLSHHDLVKIAPISSIGVASSSSRHDDHHHRKQRASPSGHHRGAGGPRASPAYSSGSPVEKTSARSSPWHTPVALTSPSMSSHKDGSGKPAIPVSPVVREEQRKEHHLLAGLLPPSSTVTSSTPPISMSLPANTFSLSSVTSSFSHPSLAASNPYLALMSPGGSSAMSSKNAAAAAAAAAYPAHLMDPATSAYYAALYSQQMYGAAGLNPYGLGAALRPGLPPSAGGMDALQAQVLQAMLSRGSPQGGGAGSSPYGSSFPGIPGLQGYFGFPPHRKDS